MSDALDRQIQETVAYGRGYTLVLLWEGPKRDQAGAEADRLQQEHLRHLFTLRNEGKLLLNGPVLDESELVGIAIYAGQDSDAVTTNCGDTHEPVMIARNSASNGRSGGSASSRATQPTT